jgi:hypothetical protein
MYTKIFNKQSNSIPMSTQLTKLIKVKDDTYERLSNRGKKNETYDDIIRKLLDLAENENNKK